MKTMGSYGDLVALDLFQPGLTKGQKTQLKIIEAAIKIYSTIGIEQATLASISKACKVSNRLVQHYFDDQETLFGWVAKYIRGQFQRFAVQAIQHEEGAENKLRAYVHSTFEWTQKFPNYAKVWALYYYYCSFRQDFKKFNTELVEMGTDRISLLIVSGTKSGVFHTSDPNQSAKLIQTVITGALVTIMTESLKVDSSEYEKSITDLCLSIAEISAKK